MNSVVAPGPAGGVVLGAVRSGGDRVVAGSMGRGAARGVARRGRR